jgi:hypothetical protein
LIGVDGAEGQPASFRVELNFNTAAEPGALTIELADEDAVSGTVAARAVLPLSYGRIASVPTSTPAPAAPGSAQVITIESPAPNTNIGSPAVLLGRVSIPPASGRLYYRVSDANGSLLGEGSFSIGNDVTRPLAFNTTVVFTLPPRDGPVAIEITDRDANGNLVGRATLDANVEAPDSYPPP